MSNGKKVLINGVNIYHEVVGHGPHAVLLMPGALGCLKTDFAPQIQQLNRDKYTIVGWDPRGYGKSRPPARDYPFDFLYRDADDAAALMETLGFTSYSLIGWSDGGNTAVILASKWSNKIKKLIMWGSNAYITHAEISTYTRLRDLSSWSDRMKQPMIDVYGKEYFEKTWHAASDVFIDMIKTSSGEYVDLYLKELPKIRADTLIIHGMKDKAAPEYHAVYLHEHIKGSQLVRWEEGRHNLHLRFPDKFNRLAERFLDAPTPNL